MNYIIRIGKKMQKNYFNNQNIYGTREFTKNMFRKHTVYWKLYLL